MRPANIVSVRVFITTNLPRQMVARAYTGMLILAGQLASVLASYYHGAEIARPLGYLRRPPHTHDPSILDEDMFGRSQYYRSSFLSIPRNETHHNPRITVLTAITPKGHIETIYYGGGVHVV
ncbi:hypothetical protein NEDG_02087 [Nematocida displodere]|uniref:Uncharacterized protein n=1 Tax=Nematocida displodere TaxID=1805483 RepID=A0A177EJW6_9MICR|nr:hypothetical protein NEDG_02087 [Nematocida displodere]